MKSIIEKAKRFGSPLRNVGTTTAATMDTTMDDPENDKYNEYEHKYATEETEHTRIFTDIYEKARLGNDGSIYYRGSCGTGATFEYNRAEFVPFLRQFLMDNQIRTVVDIGCGSLGYDKRLYNEVAVKAYYGYDVYGPVQEHNRRFSNHKKYHFFTMDVLAHKEEVAEADVCIIKDVLQHWTLAEITALLDYFVATRKFKYIMIINCCGQTADIVTEDPAFKTGDWRKLSCKFLPLRKWHPKPLLYYNSKEVSVIQTYLFDGVTAAGPLNRHASPFSRNSIEREVYRAIAKK